MESKILVLYSMIGGKRYEYSEQPERGVNLNLLKVYGDKYSLYWPVKEKAESQQGGGRDEKTPNVSIGI